MPIFNYGFQEQAHARAAGTSHVPRVTGLTCHELGSGGDPADVDTDALVEALAAMRFPWESVPDRRGELEPGTAPFFPAGEYTFSFEDPINPSEGTTCFLKLALLTLERAPVDGAYLSTEGEATTIPPWGLTAFDRFSGGAAPPGTRLWGHVFDTVTYNRWTPNGARLQLSKDTRVVALLPYQPEVYVADAYTPPNQAAYQRAIYASHGVSGGLWLVNA